MAETRKYTATEITARIEEFKREIRGMILQAETPVSLLIVESALAKGTTFFTTPAAYGPQGALVAGFVRLLSERKYHAMMSQAALLLRGAGSKSPEKASVGPRAGSSLSRRAVHAPSLAGAGRAAENAGKTENAKPEEDGK